MAGKTNLLVMKPGGTRFSDFLRVGAPLTPIVWAYLSWLRPATYEL